MRWNYRLVSALLVLTSIIGISFALYLEHVQGLDPCPLCIFQRLGVDFGDDELFGEVLATDLHRFSLCNNG